MTTPETLFATTRLTLGLSRRCALSSSSVSKSLSTTAADNILDRRKRKRDDSDQISYLPAFEGWFMVDAILTPGSAPLPRTLTSDPPLLGHRYLPVAIAGDGAFSQTILARDVLHPREPIVAIKAIKPGFEAIGKQEYNLLRRIQNLEMPKHTCIPIVHANASFSASSTYHLVLEALEPGQLSLPDCPHRPYCNPHASCLVRQSALRKVAAQLLLGLSLLHDQMGYIHADLKPENILKCRNTSAHSMKLKLIDLGNAVPIQKVDIYYDDFEVQSIHYRAPEVLLGLPFTPAIDMFSLGLILAELLLAPPENSAQTIQRRQPTFPTSPPQSHSPQLLHNIPLLSTSSPSRRFLIERTISLFGPLPASYRAGKYWSDEIPTHGNQETLLSQQMEDENVDPGLIDFIMKMLHLDPEKRISAREALQHEWLVGPLLGYWAMLGVRWDATDLKEQALQRPQALHTLARDISIDSRSSTPEKQYSPEKIVKKSHADSVKRLPPLYDFTKMEEEEEDIEDEVSQIICKSPTEPLPFNNPTKPPLKDLSNVEDPEEQDDDDEVLLL